MYYILATTSSNTRCVITSNYNNGSGQTTKMRMTTQHTHKCTNANAQLNHTIRTRWATKAHVCSSNIIVHASTNTCIYVFQTLFSHIATQTLMQSVRKELTRGLTSATSAPVSCRSPPATRGTVEEVPRERVTGTVTITGALATVRGTLLLAGRTVALAGTCRATGPEPTTTEATTRTATTTTEEGRRGAVDALPACAPDRTLAETGL